MTEARKPWAIVAHKDGHWLGVTAPDLPDIGRTLSGWLKRGCSLTTVHDRDEYNALMAGLEMWPRERKPKQPDADLLAAVTAPDTAGE